MWFKNLYLFKLEEAFDLSAEALHDALAQKPFHECLATQRESAGWVSPLGRDSDQFTHATNGFLLVTLARQEKILPASVIREEMELRVEELEEKEDRKISNREKKEMRENIEHEFLPRAFTRTQKLDAYIDPDGGWLVVNTASAKRAEELTKVLRKTLGSLPLALPETDNPPASAMTAWLNNASLPPPFTLGEECEFKSTGDETGVVAFRKHALETDEVKSNVDAGKYVSKLDLAWDNKIRFVLTEDLQIKKLRFLDVLEDSLKDHDPQSHAERLDIEFALMTGEIRLLLEDLFKVI